MAILTGTTDAVARRGLERLLWPDPKEFVQLLRERTELMQAMREMKEEAERRIEAARTQV
jgi:hypothetical protein